MVIIVFLRSFCSFRELFGHFKGSECILIIMVFLGLIWSYWSFGVILFIIGVWCYFGHFGVFGVILVIMVFSRLFWSYFSFLGYFGHLWVRCYFGHYCVLGLFCSFFSFWDYFCHCRSFVCMLVIMMFLRLFWSHWSFRGYLVVH